MITTWRKELNNALKVYGESWADIESSTLTEAELDACFDDGYGVTNGSPFTMWTKTRVYFPWCYDGAEGVASIPRHPNGEKTDHIGGS